VNCRKVKASSYTVYKMRVWSFIAEIKAEKAA
jgi:hypothetical protein